MTALVLKILGAIGALGLGVWLGLPGRYTQTPDEIDNIMASGTGRRRKRKPRFTPLAWIQRRASARGVRERKQRRGFQLESPDDSER
jgi:hypothetical protein